MGGRGMNGGTNTMKDIKRMDKIFARLAELESELKDISDRTIERFISERSPYWVKKDITSTIPGYVPELYGTTVRIKKAAELAREIASELALEGWRR